MRVAMFSWETLHSIAVGGVAAHVSELARALAARGHQVHVFTRMNDSHTPYLYIDGVHYHCCGFELCPDALRETDNMCRSMAHHLDQIGAVVGGFDLAHAHDWLTAGAIVRARNEHRLPCVFTFHSTEYGRCGHRLYEGFCRSVRDIEWQASYCSDFVIAVSEALRREVMWLYSLDERKVITVPNGVRPERFRPLPNRTQARARFGLPEHAPVVLYCGRLTWHKGPDLLLEAAAPVRQHHPHAQFLFVGDGDLRCHLEWRRNELGLQSAVQFAGYRFGNELMEAYAAADLVCIPSRSESFGLVTLEAWCAGRPVVATHAGGLPELIQHGTNGLLIHDHVDSVAWGILKMLGNPTNARRMALAGQHLAESRFTWDKIAEKTEQVYRDSVHAYRAWRMPSVPSTSLSPA